MAEATVPQLSMEARLQYEILRTEVRETRDIEQLRMKALLLVDMMEVQRRTHNAMLRQQLFPQRAAEPKAA